MFTGTGVTMTVTTSIDLLPDHLRGRLIIGAPDLAGLIGWNPGSIQRAVRNGTFPIPCTNNSKGCAFRVLDVIAYVDSIGQPVKRKRGRPRKVDPVENGNNTRRNHDG